jgi:lipopolysaccharide export system protein LptC
MNPPHSEKKGLSANWAVAEVDHLFSTLGRYTRFVVYSKWFLLVVALGLMTVLIALPLLSHDRSGIRVSFVDTGDNPAAKASSPIMTNPEYHGIDTKGEQYRVNGARAVQVTPTLIALEKVEAQLVTTQGGWRSLTADRGEYHQDTKLLVLIGNVTVIDDQGYSFTTEKANVETAKNLHITGDQPVSGVGPTGNLLASGFEIMDSGAHMIFVGGAEQVHLHIDRKQKRAK